MRALSVHAGRRRRAALAIAHLKHTPPDPKQKQKLDCIVITGRENVRWLTGFTGSNSALLLFSNGPAILYTDPRYAIQAVQQADCKVRIAKGPLVKALIRDFDRSKKHDIGLEKDHTTIGHFQAFMKFLPVRAEAEPVAGIVETLRLVKDSGEIDLIRKSVALNSAAFQAALRRFKPGMTETDLAAEIDYRSRKLGADRPAFDTIVAAAERSALPHAQPTRAAMGPGMVLIDMGAFLDGYASDMTRMVHVGKATAKYKQAYKAVLESQLAAIDAVRPGITAKAVDKVTREVLKKHGLEKQFVHSTGHGLGLEIHEAPRIGRKDGTKLEEGMVITIEPGIYEEGWGGIRIEDTVLVTKTGCEVLTPTSKDLIEL